MKEVIILPLFVCLCLSACLLDYSNVMSYFCAIFGELKRDRSIRPTNQLDFGDDARIRDLTVPIADFINLFLRLWLT